MKHIGQKSEGIMVTSVLAPVPWGIKATRDMVAAFSFKSKKDKNNWNFLFVALSHTWSVRLLVGEVSQNSTIIREPITSLRKSNSP